MVELLLFFVSWQCFSRKAGITASHGGIGIHLAEQDAAGWRRGGQAEGRGERGWSAVKPRLAQSQRKPHAAEKILAHEGVGAFQQFIGLHLQFLKQHGVFGPHQQHALVLPQRHGQRGQLRPHDHGPALPQGSQAGADFRAAQPGQHAVQHICRRAGGFGAGAMPPPWFAGVLAHIPEESRDLTIC